MYCVIFTYSEFTCLLLVISQLTALFCWLKAAAISKVPSPIQLREFGMFPQFTSFCVSVDFLIPVIAKTSVVVFCL